MNASLAFVIGAGLGLIAAKYLIKPSDCCVRVAAGVRAEVGEKLGGGAVAVGDALGLWQYTPGLLAVFGVAP